MTRKIEHIIIHCSATPPDMDIGAVEIRCWHTDLPPKGNGWADIGYHYIIRRDGVVEKGRDDSVVGAHARPWNSNSIGVCLVGGIAKDGTSDDNFTDAQRASLKTLIENLTSAYPHSDVIGHRDVPGVNKDCPSFDAKAWWAARAA